MSKQRNDEEIIPLGLVLMVVGAVILCTAVATLLVLANRPTPFVQRVQPLTLADTASQNPETNLPFLPESVPADGLESEDRLVNLEDAAQAYLKGQPERIVIQDIALDAPVSGIGLIQVQNRGQTYYQWEVPNEFRAGWHNTSAPLGQAGNTVLNGHHNINGEVFRDLIDLEEGAEIVLYDREQAYTYIVSQIALLPERDQPLPTRIKNAVWIAPTADERLTLVTCWPYEDNSHRVIVVAYPAETEAISEASGAQ